MLMKANKAKCALTRVLDVDDALKVSRKMWGHADSVKEHKDEARRAARVCETAVGEALGAQGAEMAFTYQGDTFELVIGRRGC